MKVYLVSGDIRRKANHPDVVEVLSKRKGGLVPVCRPVAVLLFSERKYAEEWAARSNKLVYEVEVPEPDVT